MAGEAAIDGTLDLGLALFLLATFAAALVAGLAGFAFGLVAAAFWLHLLTPVETATLIVGFGLIVQGIAVWQLRRALDARRLWPFLAGAAAGVPLGVAILDAAAPGQLRAGLGLLLVLYGLYGLARPAVKPVAAGGAAADAGIGFLSGMLGGVSGLGGIIATLWCGLRGCPKDEQRAVFQPVAVAIFLMTALWLGSKGAISLAALRLFLAGLPVLIAGTWIGLRLYRRLDDTGFRMLVLGLLLLSGIALLAEAWAAAGR